MAPDSMQEDFISLAAAISLIAQMWDPAFAEMLKTIDSFTSYRKHRPNEYIYCDLL